MSDRRVLAVSAALITAAIFFFLLGTYPSWKAAIGVGSSWWKEAPSAPGIPDGVPTLKTGDIPQQGAETVGVLSPPASRPTIDPVTSAPAAPLASPPVGAEGTPSFDVVRVEPGGDAVIAARTRPGAVVTLLDQGQVIAQARADASGQVAFVPPTLSPGDHNLMLSLGEPNAPGSLSSQSVAVSVPAQAQSAPMVAVLQPDQPTRLLSEAVSPVPASGGFTPKPPVSIGAVDVEEVGSVFASGHAAPGSQCRVYLNGSFIANVSAGRDGTWSLKIEHGMKPGHYSVRVDQLASVAGDVQARAEVPFDYPSRAGSSLSLLRLRKGIDATREPGPVNRTAQTTVNAAEAKPNLLGRMPAPDTIEAKPGDGQGRTASADTMDAAPKAELSTTAAPTVVDQLLTTKVIHGDSLWRISRKLLGNGRRYTQIYAANTNQIRNPSLIYPGQIFVMPQGPR